MMQDPAPQPRRLCYIELARAGDHWPRVFVRARRAAERMHAIQLGRGMACGEIEDRSTARRAHFEWTVA